jgi:hypothetical protein
MLQEGPGELWQEIWNEPILTVNAEHLPDPPLSPPRLFRNWQGKGETEQTAGFQNFRMRTFKGIGHDRWSKKGQFSRRIGRLDPMI